MKKTTKKTTELPQRRRAPPAPRLTDLELLTTLVPGWEEMTYRQARAALRSVNSRYRRQLLDLARAYCLPEPR